MSGVQAEQLWAHVASGIVDTMTFSAGSPGVGWIACATTWPAVGWLCDGTAFTLPKPKQITGTQFLARFPQAKLGTLATEAQTNDAYFLWFINCAAATSIDLTDPAVQAGVNQLVPSVLAVAEAAAILDH